MNYKTRADAIEAMKKKEIRGFSELDGVYTGIPFPVKSVEIEKPKSKKARSIAEKLSGSDPKDEELIDFYKGAH